MKGEFVMKNKELIKFINYYLFERIEIVTSKYSELLLKYELCDIQNQNRSSNNFIDYEKRILNFFNGIIQNQPLKSVEELLETWGNSALISDCTYSEATPEEIIGVYSLMKETLVFFIPLYSDDALQKAELLEELEVLDKEIQRLITETFIKSNKSK